MLVIASPPTLAGLYPAHMWNSNALIHLEAYKSQLIARAIAIGNETDMTATKVASTILENMGFDRTKHPFLSRFIHAVHLGEINPKEVKEGSHLRILLAEYQHRANCFAKIAQHTHFVSEQVLNEVARPLSTTMRRRTEREASHILMKRPTQPVPDCPGKTMPIKSCMVSQTINEVARWVWHLGSTLNTNFLTFPSAAAERSKTIQEEDYNSGLLSKKNIKVDHETIFDITDKVIRINTGELAKISGKVAFLMLGPTGAGKGLFICWCFSEKCKIDVQLEEIICDQHIVETSKSSKSHTKYIEVIPVSEKLAKLLGVEAVFVDLPGLFDKRPDNDLESLIYSLATSKAITDLRKNRHVNVYAIDISNFKSGRGPIISEMRDIIETAGEEAKLILVTKTLPKVNIEQQSDLQAFKSSKRKIEKILIEEEKYSEDSVKKVILYDWNERDLALECEWQDDKLKCQGGGGQTRAQVIQILADEMALAKPTASDGYIIDSHHQSMLVDLQRELSRTLHHAFGQGFATCNFELFNFKYHIFEYILKIRHPILFPINASFFGLIRTKIEAIDAMISSTVDDTLEKGDIVIGPGTLIDKVFEEIDWLLEFENIKYRDNEGHSPHLQLIHSHLTTILKMIETKCTDKMQKIMNSRSSWKLPETGNLVKAIFKLVERRDALVKSLKLQEDLHDSANKSLKLAINNFIRMIEKKYYDELKNCDFADAEIEQTTFNDLLTLLKNAPFVYHRELSSFSDLKISYDDYEWWDNAQTIGGAVATGVGLGISFGLGATGWGVAAGAEGFANLGRLEKLAAAYNKLTNVGKTMFTTAGIGGTFAGGATAADAFYDHILGGTCVKAWVATKFKDSVPTEFTTIHNKKP